MTTLVLCRHVEAGNDGQARALAEELSELLLDAVYTSPLERACETARAVAARHGLAPVEVDELREIDFGEADGLAFDEFPAALQRELLDRPARARFPGGETYAELQSRVCAALEGIVRRHTEQTIVVVSHAGPIRAALARWLMMDDEAIFRIDQGFGAVNVVDWVDGVPLVRLVNCAGPAGRITHGATRRSMRA
jgi:broad specificity phosphatase PhoE